GEGVGRRAFLQVRGPVPGRGLLTSVWVRDHPGGGARGRSGAAGPPRGRPARGRRDHPDAHERRVMKLFVDSANLAEIEESLARGFVAGITTKPSILAKEERTDFT